jgi:hypothetical protein
MVGIEGTRSISDSYRTGAKMTRDQELIIKPTPETIETVIDDYLGSIDATYEDRRRRCAQRIFDVFASERAAFIDALIKARAERENCK